MPNPRLGHLCTELRAQGADVARTNRSIGALQCLEDRAKGIKLVFRKEAMDWCGLDAKRLAGIAHSHQRSLQNLRWNCQPDRREDCCLWHHQCLLRTWTCLRVDACLWQIIRPFTHKNLPFISIKVGPISFTFVIQPIALIAVSIRLVQGSLPRALSDVPFTHIEVTVFVPKRAFTVHIPIVPVTMEGLAILEVASPLAMPLVIHPTTNVEFS
mmetsp:Transcript_66361/g.130751  ORF Transcript_66361/g.130751 Transcript_66361/m.130751 type:complete len:213 (-) Transcript_66361:276-914(-)